MVAALLSQSVNYYQNFSHKWLALVVWQYDKLSKEVGVRKIDELLKSSIIEAYGYLYSLQENFMYYI